MDLFVILCSTTYRLEERAPQRCPELKQPLHQKMSWERQVPGKGEVSLASGVNLDFRFPDPKKLLVTAHKDFRRFLRMGGIRDVLYVPGAKFDRARTMEIAEEVGRFNRGFVKEATSYLLIGPGRWGSSDRWLGIPVRWDQISGARVIVETDLEGFNITPSQGSHFFQNLTSFQVGYLTVNAGEGVSRLDWDWLDAQPAVAEGEFVRHIKLQEDLTVLIDGRSRRGVVLKPGMDSGQMD